MPIKSRCPLIENVIKIALVKKLMKTDDTLYFLKAETYERYKNKTNP